VQDMCEKKLYDCQKIEQIYFNRRKALSDKFQEKYESNFGKVSYLNADIAYFATLVLIEALKKEDAVKYLKEYTHHFEDVEISFDDRNVSENNKQEVWALKRGEISLYKQAIQAQRKE